MTTAQRSLANVNQALLRVHALPCWPDPSELNDEQAVRQTQIERERLEQLQTLFNEMSRPGRAAEGRA